MDSLYWNQSICKAAMSDHPTRLFVQGATIAGKCSYSGFWKENIFKRIDDLVIKFNLLNIGKIYMQKISRIPLAPFDKGESLRQKFSIRQILLILVTLVRSKQK